MDISLALQILYGLVLLPICGYAFRFGGSDEKIAAWLVFVCSAVSTLVAAVPGFDWALGHNTIMLIDFVLFAGLARLATRSRRFWPLWATAFQLIDITTHVLMLIEPSRALRAYVILQGFWAYPILLVIGIGTRRHRCRTVATRLP